MMPPPTTPFVRHAKSIAIGASSTASLCCYMTYQSYDGRVLSNDEVAAARRAIAQITPLSEIISSKTSPEAIHLSNLKLLGVTVVKTILSPSEVQEWNAKTKAAFDPSNTSHNVVWNSGRAHCSIPKRSIYYEDMARVGDKTDNHTLSTENNTPSASLQHTGTFIQRLFKKNDQHAHHKESIEQTTASQTKLQQIVRSYFEKHNISRYELTDVQFLNAYPNKSTNQIWHRDNKFRGLTAIVALKDIRENGPTELILGSQNTDYTLSSRYWTAAKRYFPPFLLTKFDNSTSELEDHVPNKPLLACIDAGDAVLYDARIFHRGRGNNCSATAEDMDRPVLVLRWDAARTPPPGAGLIVTTSNKYWGKVLYAGLYILEMLTPTDSGRKDD